MPRIGRVVSDPAKLFTGDISIDRSRKRERERERAHEFEDNTMLRSLDLRMSSTNVSTGESHYQA